MEEAAVTVIGAGVVGLAVAAELAQKKLDVVVLERHDSFGRETSSRNSEVIHAGIHHAPGSLKARLCVEGSRLLHEYCGKHGVPHTVTGKLIVAASSDQVPSLERLMARGEANGATGLVLLEGTRLKRIEPSVAGVAAILSPATGIVDSHRLMKCMYRQASAAGAVFSFGAEAAGLDLSEGGWMVETGPEGYRFRTKVVVNCAGLSSDTVAAMAGVDRDEAGYRLRYCKGSYFAYGKASPVRRLVYPLPEEDLAGLGVHATVDLAGRLRFGPDHEFVDAVSYDVDPSRRDFFHECAARLIRGLDWDSLRPDTAGVRPKLAGPGVRDFVINHEADRGLPGLVNLVGIESPGLTASLAIAGLVGGIIAEYLS